MSTLSSADALIGAVKALVKSDLAPIVSAVDQEGLYPAEFLRTLGETGGFAAALPVAEGGLGLGLSTQIEIMAEVGRECGSTAFLLWCQTTCIRALQYSPNEAVRTRYLPEIARGELLVGTGMSNPLKHLSGIENIHLKARREGDAYVVSGSLPWVSNIGEGHLVVTTASVEGGGYVMFVVSCDAEGVSLHPCPEFAGLEGTRTLNIRMKDARIPADDVVAHPDQFKSYLARLKPGFILGQIGMGLGVIDGSLRTIRESNVTTAHVNQFLDDQGKDLAEEADRLRDAVQQEAARVDSEEAQMIDVLRLRLAASELSLRAANSALLHAGAKGYLMRHPAQRRLREAVFVAIVTPALKHLRKEIHALEQAAAEVAAA